MEMYCQSCGMPLENNLELCGTNADGSKNEEYCKYCYENGTFTDNHTVEEMADFCVKVMIEEHPELDTPTIKDATLQQLKELKRWKKQ